MATHIRSHTCRSTFQDKTYGVGMRLWNTTTKGNTGSTGLRCTVCSVESSISGSTEATKKK